MKPIEWDELTAVDTSVVAGLPLLQGSCELPHRIVIRDLGDQYVVHTQIFEGGRSWYHQGDYFTKTNDSGPVVHPQNAEPLKKAWERFEARTRLALNMPDHAERLKQVADIAETIINSLMGDDEEHRRDEFENDYQLDSDVETFEQLTGKVIRPVNAD